MEPKYLFAFLWSAKSPPPRREERKNSIIGRAKGAAFFIRGIALTGAASGRLDLLSKLIVTIRDLHELLADRTVVLQVGLLAQTLRQ